MLHDNTTSPEPATAPSLPPVSPRGASVDDLTDFYQEFSRDMFEKSRLDKRLVSF